MPDVPRTDTRTTVGQFVRWLRKALRPSPNPRAMQTRVIVYGDRERAGNERP